MSEFMQNFTASKSGGSSGFARRPLQANIALQITGHDLSAPNGGVVHGVVRSPEWLAGDQVSVRMTTEAESGATFREKYTPAENTKFFRTRPTIEKLMSGFKVGKNDIEPMQVGGFLMMYGATKDLAATKEGSPTVWKAQYPENFGNDASRDVVHGVARVTLDAGADGKLPRANIDILFPKNAVDLKNIGDLHDFFADHMEGQQNGVDYNAQSVLRLVSKDDTVKTLWTYSSRAPLEIPAAVDGDEPRKVTVSASSEQTWKDGVVDGKHGRGLLRVIAAALGANGLELDANHARLAGMIKADLASGALHIEAIPGRRIPVVGSSLEDLLDPDTKASKQAQRCLVAIEGNNNKVPGFVGMTVGTMTSPARGGANLPDTVIVTKFSADDFAKARTVDFLNTANYHPPFTVKREAEAENNAEAAANAGGVETTQHEDKMPAGAEEEQDMAMENDGPGR